MPHIPLTEKLNLALVLRVRGALRPVTLAVGLLKVRHWRDLSSALAQTKPQNLAACRYYKIERGGGSAAVLW